jgi:hypothetical protein
MRAKAKPKPKLKRRTRGLTKIRQSEVARAVRGTVAAGLSVRGVEVDPVTGKFSVLIGPPTESGELDDWLMRKKDARPA